MSNPLFFSLAAVGAAVLIALALVTPQGLGARSPAPFGHPLGPLTAPAYGAPPPVAAGATAPPAGLRGPQPADGAAR